MPRAAALAVLILAFGVAAAETKPNSAPSAATLPPAAAVAGMPVMVPGLAMITLERQPAGNFGNTMYMDGAYEIVATLSNSSAEAVPKGTHGVELKCTSPWTPPRTVRRVLDAVGPHGRLEVRIFEGRQSAPGAPAPSPFPLPQPPNLGIFGGQGPTSEPPRPLEKGPAWSCTAGLVAPRARLSSGATKTVSWGPEVDFGISDLSFEKAATAPPSVNVRVSVLVKWSGGGAFMPPGGPIARTLRLACSKPGEVAKNAEAAAAASVLFGAAGVGLLPAPATGWTCRAMLVGPGPDTDPSNDTWATTAP